MPGTKRALFLDWGGTLALTKDNRTVVDAAGNPILMPNVPTVLARERPGYDACFIVSNQARIAKGEISVAEVVRRFAWANEHSVVSLSTGGSVPTWMMMAATAASPSPGCSSSSQTSMASISPARLTSGIGRKTAPPPPWQASDASSGHGTSSAGNELVPPPAQEDLIAAGD